MNKSAHQILKSNPDLYSYPEVEKLINYIEELEDEVVELKQKKDVSSEAHLKVLVSDINSDLYTFIEGEEKIEWVDGEERADRYLQTIKNLRKYIVNYVKDYNIKL
jgi:translation initiation factor 2B subunit (eIF-2B alpha/beta/delta family)